MPVGRPGMMAVERTKGHKGPNRIKERTKTMGIGQKPPKLPRKQGKSWKPIILWCSKEHTPHKKFKKLGNFRKSDNPGKSRKNQNEYRKKSNIQEKTGKTKKNLESKTLGSLNKRPQKQEEKITGVYKKKCIGPCAPFWVP